ncbi:TetR/AcrR family transcriptional regulator [Zhihengliuella halotolerans]|uniref:TetR family transcriptional regulator n=1 Tax=Zhihengliuella halotolerans TaxID=370736 RepID=A0A4Q8AB39_9MICC|nr:TetR/AcrR family transcriptional regulator [Zhihengliuella halotolerans]RZU60861.1 TetR family transcriptional regulator [Zhihengliuella halotolerans]
MTYATHEPSDPGNAGRPTDQDLTQRILLAAATLVIEEGYSALKIEHVAKRAGCGKAAVYRRFTDKGALVAAAIKTHVSLGDIPDRGNLIDDLLDHALQNQSNQRLVDGKRASGQGFTAMFEPDVYVHLWEDFFRLRRDRGVEIIDRAVARGEVPADIDRDLVLDTIAGLTIYRQSIKQIHITGDQFRAVISALVENPPRYLQ